MGAGGRVMRGMLVVLCLGLVSLGWLGGPAGRAVAQGDQPAPGEQAVAYLPPADAFGPAWKRFEPVAASNLPADTIREGVFVTYGGPEGARIILFALLVEEGRVRQGWDEAGTLFQNLLSNIRHDDQRLEQLRSVPPPAGCAEAKRAEGRAFFDGFAVGITLCAADPDLILLAAVAGGVSGADGVAASDNVIDAAFEAAGVDREPSAGGDDDATGIVMLEAYDIGWRTADQPGPQVSLTAAPGTTIEIVNTGAAGHNFDLEALGIFADLPPGATAQVEIPADTPPGEYEFVCSVPGHAQAGMVGTIVIE